MLSFVGIINTYHNIKYDNNVLTYSGFQPSVNHRVY